MPIKLVQARQVYDSIGNPTVEVDVATELGLFRTAAPNTDKKLSGEMHQLRDHIPNMHHGLGVQNAIKNINTVIGPQIVKESFEVVNQKGIDDFMIRLDNTDQRTKYGANALMALSMAVAKAGAARKGVPLFRHIADLSQTRSIKIPVPHLVIMTGGERSENKLPFAEYCVMPTGALSYEEGLKCGTDIYRETRKLLEQRFGKNTVIVTDSGGLNPPFIHHRDAMFLLAEVIWRLNYGTKVDISLNVAASVMYKEKAYDLDYKNNRSDTGDYVDADALAKTYNDNLQEFGVISIEDPFASEDWEAWPVQNGRTRMQYIANELTQTNLKRCRRVVETKAADTVVLKLNQCSTITEVLDILRLVRSHEIAVMIEDRLGDTVDKFLADFAVGTAAGQVKFGAPCRGEHTAKLNHIMRIEEELGGLAKYVGKNYRVLLPHKELRKLSDLRAKQVETKPGDLKAQALLRKAELAKKANRELMNKEQ